MSWPMVDMADPEAVRRRALEYLDLCAQYDTKPLVSGLCIVMGTNRDEVTKWAKGQKTSLGYRLSPESSLELQNALANLEVLWEFAMQNNGYRNPVTGIFLGKNNFNYKDISETVIRHESASAGPSRAQLAEKYAAALPAEDVRVEDPDEPKRLSSGD
ncbi:hypothetical protein K6V98_08260 [Collinsella sp. AGMB00827]|uniref:Uncharacterized protein n=1 Tax=Collinsella ureilytica TaxID=2869515 RepID=A0ABS7MM23_9ACTN|nr:hypothetical protein [Collinsella urealyticum]MBY4798337.1 hypothetical protein [Collinsella urealyticum]